MPSPSLDAASAEPSIAAETLPIYQAIKDDIVAAIQSGRLKPADRVSSEHELVRQYGVSRMTANRALRELTQEGFVTRLRGVGTFVAEKTLNTDFLALPNIPDEIRARGQDYGCRLISVGAVTADATAAEVLGLAVGDPLYRVRLVHTQNGKPIQVEDRSVNPAMAPGFLDVDFSQLYPGAYLHSVAPVDEVEHIVEAVIAGQRERDFLGIAAGEPCLRLIRRTWSNGRPVSWVWFTYPGRFYRLTARFRVNADSGGGS